MCTLIYTYTYAYIYIYTHINHLTFLSYYTDVSINQCQCSNVQEFNVDTSV